jgi:hypothetical protein
MEGKLKRVGALVELVELSSARPAVTRGPKRVKLKNPTVRIRCQERADEDSTLKNGLAGVLVISKVW